MIKNCDIGKRCFLMVAVTVLFVGASVAKAEIEWLAAGGNLVKESKGFENIVKDNFWQGNTLDAVYPRITMPQVKIDANADKYLYLKMVSTKRNTLRIFFSPDTNDTFYTNWSCNVAGLKSAGTSLIYRVDLSTIEAWQGMIGSIRIDLLGHTRGDMVRFEKMGVSAKPVDKADGMDVVSLTAAASWLAHDRLAAWNTTVVRTNSVLPNSCLLTYLRDKVTATDQYMLVKMAPGVEGDDGMIWANKAKRAEVVDFPGGVKAEFFLGDVRVTTEITALMEGREVDRWEGAAVYRVRTDPAVPVTLRLGGGERINMNVCLYSGAWMTGERADFKGSVLEEASERKILLTSNVHPVTAGVRIDSEFVKKTSDKNIDFVEVTFEKGEGQILLAFADDKNKTVELLDINIEGGVDKVNSYYSSLLNQRRIETPEKVMDDAFRSAVVLMDYSWYPPYGWMECPHHWLALWHMQCAGAAHWMDQADRSKMYLVKTAKKLFPGDAIPQYHSNGSHFRSFGGSNQYFFWQVREYLKQTNDLETLKKLAPTLDKVLDSTLLEYDPEGDMLSAWGFQIGNQEDMITTPYNGTSTTIEVINMMQTRAMVADLLGDTKTAERMATKIRQAKAGLKKQLWMKDLGRFMFYKDPTGKKMPEGQYQTYISPVIWDVADQFDSWTSMRHLRDRLMGKLGEVYLSNNFPDHLLDIWATWGMQAGAAQQPWGAWGLSAAGLNNETYRPLKAVSQWVMSDLQRGAWPEVASENRMGYFSPPAGLFVQSVTEALFGLWLDKPDGSLTIAPSIPDDWPEAKLQLPDFEASYAHKGNTLRYTIKSRDSLKRKLRWKLPPCEVKYVKANGRKIAFDTRPMVNCIVLEADAAAAKETAFEIKVAPLKFKIECPASIAEGQPLELKVKGLTIEKIEDRCGVLSQTFIKNKNTLQAKIQEGLLDDYLKYGRLGQMNFSRRSFFVYCKSKKGVSFWLPIDLSILPRYEAAIDDPAIALNALKADVLVRNNTQTAIKGKTVLKALDTETTFEINIAPRSEKTFVVNIADGLANLSPGDNKALLILPENDSIDLTMIVTDALASQADAIAKKMEAVPLPQEALISGPAWRNIRRVYFHLHNPAELLNGFSEGTHVLKVPQLPGVSFEVNNRQFVPISENIGRKTFVLPMGSKIYKKIYMLVIPLVESHDIFSETAQIHVQLDDPDKHPQIGKSVVTRTLNSPGDIDCWFPANYMAHLGSFKAPRQGRYTLLPLLGQQDGDWIEAQPPAFVQPEYWSSSIGINAGDSVLNVIEIDLGRSRKVNSIIFTITGTDPGFGLVAVTGEKEQAD